MTNTDKTRQKLVESMRKSKTGNTSTAGQPAASTRAAPRTGKSQARRATTKSTKTTTPVARKKTPAKTNDAHTVADPYQSGRRVWPD